MTQTLLDVPGFEPFEPFPDLPVVTRGDRLAWATFSPCERYRYALGRTWGDAPLLVVKMQNPSVATHDENDRTVTKVVRYAERDGFGGVAIVNAFGMRSPYPSEVIAAFERGEDIVGPHNEEIVRRLLALAGRARVAAWGVPKRAALRPWMPKLTQGDGWRFWDITEDGYPRHPLYLRSSAQLKSL